MQKDRSHWTVRKVSFAEAERLDDEYYASLTMAERVMMLMDLRSAFEEGDCRIKPIAVKRHLHEKQV